ncbi:hypothetical protein [Marinobacter oulmenensis]|uniref:Putative RNA-binding Zn-ribbon protein involved in translation (DUF1610 family) n=1 Tax=Marinobacter oulmenensis TaxID=643747 RepID=A0A840UA65_9GAMM|nr:hypothetical protein [Marinobacter oulmenensis]MBB5319561.1 putative RNA-binding Zn-ribbon protein involved in translation (DUF1610 family) [Marinobacter oulmenensis]
MSAKYLTPDQDARLRRWERWNRNYFLFAFVALIIVLVFSSQLGLSSGNDWGGLGVLIALLITPIIVLQLRLKCPACGTSIGWQAKLMAPDQCKSCGAFLRAKNTSS